MSRRLERVNQLLRKEISQILLKEFDFGNVFVSLTEVKTTPDLNQARIFITTFPEEKEKEVLLILKRGIFSLQKKINKRLKMKTVPKIQFEIDKGVKNLYKIDEIENQRYEKKFFRESKRASKKTEEGKKNFNSHPSRT